MSQKPPLSWFRSHSVRVSLTLWNVAAMIIVIAVYAAGVFVFVSRQASDALDKGIRDDSQWAAAMADRLPDGTVKWFDDPANFGEDSPWLQVWCSDATGCGPHVGNGEVVYRTVKADRNPIPATEALARRADDGIVSISADAATYRVLTTATTLRFFDTDVDNHLLASKHVVIQVARSETMMHREMTRLLIILLLGLPVGVATAGGLGYYLARRALAPVESMAERAQSITADNLHDRLPVDNPNNEIGRLATVFNDTLGRLEGSFEQMRRFTADVSHELRTPLTAIRSVGEVGLRDRRDEPAYRGIIGSMLEEVDRLSSLVDRLLRLSRAETGQAKLAREAIALDELAEDVCAHLGVLAEEKQQTLTIERVGLPRGLGDRLVLRQSLINLVDNAIKYSPAGGTILVRAADGPAAVTLDVIDSGPGIAPELRHRIFDRYNHEGRTESGDLPGTGLGLSISKWALQMNGGRLTLEPPATPDTPGSTFRITLPRAPAPRGQSARRRSVA
jgi:signal transduction histidine kinase